jgi:hypothetical protein
MCRDVFATLPPEHQGTVIELIWMAHLVSKNDAPGLPTPAEMFTAAQMPHKFPRGAR